MSKHQLPDVRIGKLHAAAYDWRTGPEDDGAVDDERLPETPPDVVAMLGFDPLEIDDGGDGAGKIAKTDPYHDARGRFATGGEGGGGKDGAAGARSTFVLTARDADGKHKVVGAYASDAGGEGALHAAREFTEEDPNDIQLHAVDKPLGAKPGDTVHVVSSPHEHDAQSEQDIPAAVHSVHGDSAEATQRATAQSRVNWEAHGDAAWWKDGAFDTTAKQDKELEAAWSAKHGGEGSGVWNASEADQRAVAYETLGAKPYPGLSAANRYFANDDMRHLQVVVHDTKLRKAGDAEVGKAAATPFRAIPPLDLDRAELKRPESQMRVAWARTLSAQRRAASAAITATLSSVAKADAPSGDDASAEDRAADDGWTVERIDHAADQVAGQLSFDLDADDLANIRRSLVDTARDSAARTYSHTAGVELGDEGEIFDQINTRAVEWADEHAGDLVSGVNATTRDAVRQEVAAGLANGENYKQIIARVEGLGAFSDDRANLIGETEIANANSAGALNGLFQARGNGVDVKKGWLTAGGLERVCPICVANEAVGPLELEEPFPSGDQHSPAHPRCLPGDALVRARDVLAYSKRWYEGEMVVIRTAAQDDLRCTPNHPVLTDRGWIAAGLLNEGCNVIRALGAQRESASDPDAQDMPSRIEDIAEAFRLSGQMLAREVPVSAEDFHGDGKGSKVAVIGTDRLLWDRLDAALREHGGQSDFERVGPQALALDSERGLDLLRKGDGYASGGVVNATEARFPLFGEHLLPFDGFSFGRVADMNSGLLEPESHAVSLDAKRLRDSILGHATNVGSNNRGVIGGDSALEVSGRAATAPEPKGAAVSGKDVLVDAVSARKVAERLFGEVILDEILSVRRVPFAGHVFNLETESHVYLVSGVVSHNCRCALTPYVKE